MTAGRRRILLAAAFIAALVSAALAPSEEAPPPKRAAKSPAPGSSAPQSRAPQAPPREVAVPPVANYKRTLEEAVSVVDVFEARQVPSATPVAAPPKPVAPPPPFQYAGLIDAAGRPKAVLVQGEQLHIIGKGESFAGAYRLDDMDAERLVVTYVPLGVQQSLTVGAQK